MCCKKKQKNINKPKPEPLADFDTYPQYKTYFIFCGTYSGSILQYTPDCQLIHEHKDQFSAMIVDLDYNGDHLYVADADGHVKNYSINQKTMIHDWGNVSEFGCNYIAVTSEKLFMVNCAGETLIFNLVNKKLIFTNNFGKDAMTMLLRTNSIFSFSSSQYGDIKQFQLKGNKEILHIDKHHDKPICAMFIKNSKLFTGDDHGYLQEYDFLTQPDEEESAKDKTFNYGQVVDTKIQAIGGFGDVLIIGDNCGAIKKFSISKRMEIEADMLNLENSEVDMEKS